MSAIAPLQGNALRNYGKIRQAARTEFARDPYASVLSIARVAGVGASCVYRHFPVPEDMVLDVYREDVEEIGDAISRMLTRDPANTFRAWGQELAVLMSRHPRLGAICEAPSARTAANETYLALVGITRGILELASRRNHLSEKLSAEDVLMLLSATWGLESGDKRKEEEASVLQVIVELVFDVSA